MGDDGNCPFSHTFCLVFSAVKKLKSPALYLHLHTHTHIHRQPLVWCDTYGMTAVVVYMCSGWTAFSWLSYLVLFAHDVICDVTYTWYHERDTSTLKYRCSAAVHWDVRYTICIYDTAVYSCTWTVICTENVLYSCCIICIISYDSLAYSVYHTEYRYTYSYLVSSHDMTRVHLHRERSNATGAVHWDVLFACYIK